MAGEGVKGMIIIFFCLARFGFYVRISVLMVKKYLRTLFLIALYGLALIGFILTAGFFAVKFHLTDSLGQIDFNDRYFSQSASAIRGLVKTPDRSKILNENLCRAQALKKIYPENGSKILTAFERSQSDIVLAQMLSAAEIYLTDNTDYQSEIKKCDNPNLNIFNSSLTADPNLYTWINTPEWQTLKEGLAKDKEVITLVSTQTDVSARLIAAQIVGEQLRLFHTEREVYKQIFQPLKILGNEVKFSLGVAGIKEETAIQIEENLLDRNSPFYIGSKYEKLLAFQTTNQNEERFNRLTDSKDHSYSYLYTALFLKQIQTQWEKAGFDISDRPEILATIFNIGFDKSIPKADPHVGGSEIEIGNKTYTFGALAYDFYFSGEMLDEFGY